MDALFPILGLILSFFCGAIPFGPLLSRMNKIDLRAVGSGNVGATNVYRALGLGWAVAVFAGDAGKGLGPTLLMRWLLPGSGWYLAAGVAAVLGHVFNPFLGGKGGKGVATGFGSMVGISPLAALASLGLWLLIMAVKRVVSLASLAAAVLLPAVTLALAWEQAGWERWGPALAALAIVGLVVASHRDNIGRLRKGEESVIRRDSGPEPSRSEEP